jgi:hypothetical protein
MLWPLKALSRRETAMIITRKTQPESGDNGRNKGCVLKGAADYKAEQGTQYAPGISAETIGSLATSSRTARKRVPETTCSSRQACPTWR